MKEFHERAFISMLDAAKTGARVNARQHFVATLSAIAHDLGLVRSLCAKLARRARQ